MNRLTGVLAGAVVLLANGPPPSGEEAVRASANDNRRPAGAMRSERSVVSIVGAWLFDGSWASGTVPAPAPSFGRHWCAPAGLLNSSHSWPNRI